MAGTPYTWIWEDALKSFAGSNDSVVTRGDVTSLGGTSGSTGGSNTSSNSGSNSGSVSVPSGSNWIILDGGWHVGVVQDNANPPQTIPSMDVMRSFDFVMTNTLSQVPTRYTMYMGCDLNWNQWDARQSASASDPFFKFMQQTSLILDGLLGSPGKNDTTDFGSFDAATSMIDDVRTFLEGWAPQIKKWSDSLHVHGSDWQGSAAGEFKALLDGVVTEFNELLTMMSQPADIASTLADDKAALRQALLDMREMFVLWQNQGQDVWPHDCVQNALDAIWSQTTFHWASNNVLVGQTLIYEPHFYFVTPNGNPISQDFWNQLEIDAKQRWASSLKANLDPLVATVMGNLDTAYIASADALAMGLGQVSLTMPPPPNTGLGGLGNLTGGNLNLNSMLGPGGSGNLNLNGLLGNTNGGGLLGSNGSGAEIILPNGKPFLDPKTHKPFGVPAGSTINANGQVFDALGNPVLGPDGKPLKVQAGSTIKSDAPPSTLSGGNPLTVPKGSKIEPNGNVVDGQGHAVTDTNGNPIVLPHGAKILANGTVVDANGNPISNDQQLMVDEQAALNNPGTGRGISLPPAVNGNIPTVGGLGGLTGGTGSSGTGVPVGAPGSNLQLLPGTSLGGLSPTALQNSAAIANGLGATELGAAQTASAQQALAAAEEAQLAGHGLGGATSSPYMPPMGGMGAGMGAGANPNEKDRQRTTWLSEDEEVWGTESTTVDGVIGR